MSQHLKFLRWNVKGLNHPVKRRKVFSHIKQFNTDVAFLQDGGRLLTCWKAQCFRSHFQVKARGVSILISQNTPFEEENVVADKHGRFIIVSGKRDLQPCSTGCL
uniref:Endonuclease/exonuclease/phosphatase domain-containing protein n=1 Tax=Poecilia reticulata TaxID=8081 RepID=A0A3P9QEW6_POERE